METWNASDSATADASPDGAELQIFSQWTSRRLALYQDMQQQVQTSITQLMQLSSEFTMQLEEEVNSQLARYWSARASHQQELEEMRQAMNDLRMLMAQEQQAHRDTLATTRQEEEARLAQERQTAQSEIEGRRAAAKDETEQLLRDAYAERDRVLAETRTLSARLAELQQMMQGMLGTVKA
jgi:hypothetical protein